MNARTLSLTAASAALALTLLACSPSARSAGETFPIQVRDDPNGWGMIVIDSETGCEYIGVMRNSGFSMVPRTNTTAGGPKQRGCRSF